MEATKRTFLKSTLAVALLASGAAFAAATPPTSGQLVIINSLGNAYTGNVGSTPSSVSVVVYDSVNNACSTTPSLAYNGTITVKWSASNTHSATSCTGIYSVAVTPLKTTIGSMSTVVYDATTATTVPTATAQGSVTFMPPTTAAENLALIINGNGVPSSAVTVGATVWGVGAAVAPIFDVNNGALTTVGVPGAVGAYGLKAESLMQRYGVRPFKASVN